jgi:pimeloyl-ACP methyl ester carboxylesterase/DNA-binding winged helix-turn-helix (wHTH) protein
VPGKVYTFGPFRLEADERRLIRGDQVVPLAGKAFDTLLLLVEGAGALQQQRTLLDRLWPDVVVEPNSLQYNVSLVRRALGSAPGAEIQTVRGQGYRLVADVRRIETGTAGTGNPPGAAPHSAPLEPQRTTFCKAADGARLAYAAFGRGPPIVKAANWLSHLELDWDSPVWSPWLELLGRGRCLLRYDARGNGLSDWEPPSISFDDFVSDLGAVFDAAGVERAPVLGISHGAAVAVAYAARNPGRVSALVLIGGCARGWRVKGHPELVELFEALMVLMRQGWGVEHTAFRQLFTAAFFPDGPQHHADWFNELQRQTTTPDNAARLLSAFGDVDVRPELSRVSVPTLVLHGRGDLVIPIKDGIELASGIAGARFVPLESRNHILQPEEPAWNRFAGELEAFLAEVRDAGGVPAAHR